MDDGREDKNPWDKWYWQDWSSDPAVQSCGFAAKGFWMDLLAIMAKSKIKGKLLDNESKMNTKTIAKLTRSTIEEITPLLDELREHGVFSEDAEGIMFNRRMLRIAELSEIRSQCGKLGGRPKSKSKAKIKSKTKAPSVYAYDLNINKNLKEGEESLKEGGGNKRLFDAWWNRYPRKIGKQESFEEYQKIIKTQPPEKLDQALSNYLGEIRKLGTEERFIKHPTTFLRKSRWMDYLEKHGSSSVVNSTEVLIAKQKLIDAETEKRYGLPEKP